MKKRYFVSMLAAMTALSSGAQTSSTLSPYSQFGLGTLADQSMSFNRGMGGVAYGMRGGKFINMQNPASYSAVDSLTMLLDAGVTGQITNFKEEGKSINSKTGNFDYAAISFRILPKLGFAAGIIPYSNIGYDYDRYGKLNELKTTEGHNGSGGLTQVFFGLGWQFMKGFSAGFNFSYLWGQYDKGVDILLSESTAKTITRNYSANISSYKVDFGLQWQNQVSKNDLLTLGATVGIGHKLNGDADMSIDNYDPLSGKTNSTKFSIEKAFSLPWSFGLGASLTHNNSLTMAVDYTFQKWANFDYPAFNDATDKYSMTSGYFKDRHKVAGGVNWVPDPTSRRFFKLVNYRFGVSYATPYYKIGNGDGADELTVSAGFGLPIYNAWNSRSMLNISAQWVRTSAPGLLKENTFRINIGLTFNERWFAKWKVD